jgi:hypothetical protein
MSGNDAPAPTSPLMLRASVAVTGMKRTIAPVATDIAAKIAFAFRLVSLVTLILTLGISGTIAIATSASVAAMSAAATTRMWLLRGAPHGHILPLTFDFENWRHTGRAHALLHVAEAAPHCTHGDASQLAAELGSVEAVVHAWEACEGHFTPIVFTGGPGAFTVSLLLELPEHMSDAGMITSRITVQGKRGVSDNASDGTEAFEVAKGVGSAPVRRQSQWLHMLRSLLFLPLRLAGAEVNTQLVEVPLLRGFAPPENIAAAITGANVTLSTSRPFDDVQVYGARLALDVELRGWTTYYLQRYPMRTFTLLFGVFFSVFFGTATSVASVLICGTVVWLDLGRLAVAFVTWSFGKNHPQEQQESPRVGGADTTARCQPKSVTTRRSGGMPASTEAAPRSSVRPQAAAEAGAATAKPAAERSRLQLPPLRVEKAAPANGPPTGGREPRARSPADDQAALGTPASPSAPQLQTRMVVHSEPSAGEEAAAVAARPQPADSDGAAEASARPAEADAPSPAAEGTSPSEPQTLRRRGKGQRRAKQPVSTLET